MKTPRRPSIVSRSSLASRARASYERGRLREIQDHWLSSPVVRLLALLITGYLSYEIIPHRWLSFGLAIGGGCAFVLGALASVRGGALGELSAQRRLTRGLRLGLYLLLVLSSRLYYAHRLEQSIEGDFPLGESFTAIVESQDAPSEVIGGTSEVYSEAPESTVSGDTVSEEVHPEGAARGRVLQRQVIRGDVLRGGLVQASTLRGSTVSGDAVEGSEKQGSVPQGGSVDMSRQQGARLLHVRLCSASGSSSLLLLSLRPVSGKGEPTLQVGDTLTFRLRWVSYTRDLLERRPNYGRYLLSLGAVGRGEGEVVHVRPTTSMALLGSSPRGLALRLRDQLASRLMETPLRPATKRLLLGMTLGMVSHDAEGRALRQPFVRGGVAHLLAVSGFHLAVVVGAFALLLGAIPMLRRKERLRWGLLLLVAWGFTLISGCSVPTLRASGMLTIYAGGRMLRRPTSFAEVIALPALLQLAFGPLSLFGASFLLTYLALVSIRLFYRPIWGALGKLHHPLMRYLWGCLALTLAVQPILFPLCLYLFGGSSIAYLWTTLLLLPLATLLIPAGLLLGGVVSLGYVPPMPILWLVDEGAWLMYEGVGWAEGLPMLQVHCPLSLGALLSYYTLLLLLFLLVSVLRDKPAPIEG